MRNITTTLLNDYAAHLIEEEKSPATVRKYLHDVQAFFRYITDIPLTKAAVLRYKASLTEKYKPASVNTAIAALNNFFTFAGRLDLKVKSLKIQRQIFSHEEKELSKSEYLRLLHTAKEQGNERLYLLLQTICSTGIRVSELCRITIAALRLGYAEIDCKGKRRKVFLPSRLCKMLSLYARRQKIKSGAVFVTKNGNPLDRSNIWSDMKKLCKSANVPEEKVFPHNLRHLFARTYYAQEKDIVRLADILGHASIDTARIYTSESGKIHRRQIQRLDLLFTT